jgi:hypothetical protein
MRGKAHCLSRCVRDGDGDGDSDGDCVVDSDDSSFS